jgi:hypothetical protein
MQDTEDYIKLEVSDPIFFNATDLTATKAVFALAVRGFDICLRHACLKRSSARSMRLLQMARVCPHLAQLLAIRRRSLRGDGWGSGPRNAKTVSSPDALTNRIDRSGSDRRPCPPASTQHSSPSGISSPTVFTSKELHLGMQAFCLKTVWLSSAP